MKLAYVIIALEPFNYIVSSFAENIFVVYVCCGLKAGLYFSLERVNFSVFVVFFLFVYLLQFLVCLSERYLGFCDLKKANKKLECCLNKFNKLFSTKKITSIVIIFCSSLPSYNVPVAMATLNT